IFKGFFFVVKRHFKLKTGEDEKRSFLIEITYFNANGEPQVIGSEFLFQIRVCTRKFCNKTNISESETNIETQMFIDVVIYSSHIVEDGRPSQNIFNICGVALNIGK